MHLQYTHTAILRPFYRDYPGEPVPEEIFFWTFMVQWKITEADTPTIRMDATPSGLISDSPLAPPFLRRMRFLLQPSQFILAWDRLFTAVYAVNGQQMMMLMTLESSLRGIGTCMKACSVLLHTSTD